MKRIALTIALTAVALLASLLAGCAEEGTCSDVTLLQRMEAYCEYWAECDDERYKLCSLWQEINGASARVTYICESSSGTHIEKSVVVDQNPPPFCTAEGFKEHCGFEVPLP